MSQGYAAIALTDGVRAAEARLGSAPALARLPGHRPADGGAEPRDALTEFERDVVADRDVVAHDWNCHQHITPRYSLAELRAAGHVPLPDGR